MFYAIWLRGSCASKRPTENWTGRRWVGGREHAGDQNNEVRTEIQHFVRIQNQCMFVRGIWYVVDFPVCYVRSMGRKQRQENTGDKAMR